MSLEGDYQRALLARASLEFRDVRIFRRNVGSIKVEDRLFRASIPGQCDLYAIDRNATHYEIELKRFGVLNDAQKRWRDHCLAWGWPWLLLRVERSETEPQTIARWLSELGEFFALGRQQCLRGQP